uniref:Peptidase A1 domain-containing protein n=1 Tax=Bursaphelenchus xylophilus TaxID=6326 RepID=A0A1I7S2J7_BURXY
MVNLLHLVLSLLWLRSCEGFRFSYKRDFPAIPITLTGYNGKAASYDLELDLESPLTLVFGEECQEAGFCTQRAVKPFHPTMKTYEYDLFDTSLNRASQFRGRMHREKVEIGAISKNLSIGVALSLQNMNNPAELNADGSLGLGFLNRRVAIIDHLFEHAGKPEERKSLIIKQSRYSPVWSTKEKEHFYPEQEGQIFLAAGENVAGCDDFDWFDTMSNNGTPSWYLNGSITVLNRTEYTKISFIPSAFTKSKKLKSMIPMDIEEDTAFPNITIRIEDSEYVMTHEDYVTLPMKGAEHLHRSVFADSRNENITLFGMDMLHRYCVALSKASDGTYQLGLAVNNGSGTLSCGIFTGFLAFILVYCNYSGFGS